jgi:maltose O-acetyltransferase
VNLQRKADRLLYEQALARIPYNVGASIRGAVLRRMCRFGPGARIAEHVHLVAPWLLTIEAGAGVSPGAILDCRGGLRIGRDAMIGIQAVILTSSHGHDRTDLPMRLQGMRFAPVDIGCDVWLGARVIVLPGVTVGDGAIVGAGAVVTRDVPPYCVAAGVPATVLRERTVTP